MSLRKKILCTCVGSTMLFAITIGVFLSVQMGTLKTDVIESNSEYTQMVGSMSADSTTAQMRKRMMDLTKSNAQLANSKFEELEKEVVIQAELAAKLYEAPDDYGRVTLREPDAANDGTLSVQLLHSAKVKELDTPSVQDEIGLLGNLSDTLYAINSNSDAMASNYVAMESGLMVQADSIAASKFDEDGNVMPYEADERPWYVGAESNGKAYFTPVSRDAHTDDIGIMCGVPIYVNGEFSGVAGAGMYLHNIGELVDDLRLGADGYACIINQDGQVIFSPKEDGELCIDVDGQTDLRVAENVSLAGAVRSVLAGSSGITTLELDGATHYIAYAPMEKVGWAFLTVLSEEEVLSSTNELLKQLGVRSEQTEQVMQQTIRLSLFTLIMAILIFGIIVIIASSYVSMRIGRPIRLLTERVGAVDGDNLDFKWEGGDSDSKDEIEVLAAAFMDMTQKMKQYIANIMEITAEKERIGAELNVATKIQADMLPKIFPAFPERTEFDVYAKMDPAKEVGGDFYDFFLIDDDHLAIVIADVSSKGVPAALFMVIAKTLIKNHALNQETPDDIFRRVNNQLCEGNEEGMFVTAWMGVLTISTGDFEFVNAGHNPQLLLNTEKYDWIDANPGFVLAGLEGIPYQSQHIRLQHGARIFLYTDGVTEAQNRADELFGEDRLLESLAKNGAKPLEEMLTGVRADIDAFVGDAEQFDDITMLAFEYH